MIQHATFSRYLFTCTTINHISSTLYQFPYIAIRGTMNRIVSATKSGQRVSLFARLAKARGVSIEACAYQILLPRRNSANSVAFHAKRIPTARTRTRACIATGVKSSSAVEHGVSSPAFVYATSCRWLKGLESKKKIRWRICHESRSLAVRGKTRWWQDEGTEGVRLVRWIQKLVLWELLVFFSLSFSLSLFLYFFLFTV